MGKSCRCHKPFYPHKGKGEKVREYRSSLALAAIRGCSSRARSGKQYRVPWQCPGHGNNIPNATGVGGVCRHAQHTRGKCSTQEECPVNKNSRCMAGTPSTHRHTQSTRGRPARHTPRRGSSTVRGTDLGTALGTLQKTRRRRAASGLELCMETPAALRGRGRTLGVHLHLWLWPMPGAGNAEGWGPAAQQGPKVGPWCPQVPQDGSAGTAPSPRC